MTVELITRDEGRDSCSDVISVVTGDIRGHGLSLHRLHGHSDGLVAGGALWEGVVLRRLQEVCGGDVTRGTHSAEGGGDIIVSPIYL